MMDKYFSDLNAYQQNTYYITIMNPEEYGFSHKKIFEIAFTYFPSCIYVAVLDEVGEIFHTHVLMICSSPVNSQSIHQYFKNVHIEQISDDVGTIIDYMRKKQFIKNPYKKTVDNTFEECIHMYKSITREKGVSIYGNER